MVLCIKLLSNKSHAGNRLLGKHRGLTVAFPNGLSAACSNIISLEFCIFQRIATCPVDVYRNCLMDFQWHFQMHVHAHEICFAIFCPDHRGHIADHPVALASALHPVSILSIITVWREDRARIACRREDAEDASNTESPEDVKMKTPWRRRNRLKTWRRWRRLTPWRRWRRLTPWRRWRRLTPWRR